MTSRTKLGLSTWLLPIALLALSACKYHDHIIYITPDGGVIGDGGDVGDGGDGGMAACATQSAKAEIAPLDILLILDTSASMDYLGKWISVKQAVQAFINNAGAVGLGLGLQYYPLRAQCNRGDYATPAVPIQVLPLGITDIANSLAIQQMSGGTPMVPALEGAYDYLKSWSENNPTHKVVLVLATDGTPDASCIAPSPMGMTNSLANATLTAMNAFTMDPKISTFVIGVGEDTMQLQQIASAGGGTALFVDTNADIQGAFLDALTQIRGNALSCQFPIPMPTGTQMLDYTHVNVVFTPGDGSAPVSLINVGDQASCHFAHGKGWYYDAPAMPKAVVLCQDACSAATTGASGRIDVVFGCKTMIL